MPDRDGASGTTAVLVVHGIGAQTRGETLARLLAGLSRVEGGAALNNAREGEPVTFGGRPVRFYEVYWADLLKGDVMAGAFQMDELQSLSWFPFFNWLRGTYQRGRYSPVTLLWWCVVLPIVNFFLLFGYYGSALVAQVWSGTGTRRDKDNDRGAKLTMVDSLMDEYAGDVFTYVNSAGGAFYRDKDKPPVPAALEHVYAQVVQRFYEQILKADADGCKTIQIVAHSLGTVVTYHALTGLQFDAVGGERAEAIRAASGKVRRIYTIGSPLEKIRFFWPRLVPESRSLGGTSILWDNFVSWFDPVAGTLRTFGDLGKLTNHRLLGGGFIRGHVVYERSPVFVCALAQGLSGHDMPLIRSRGERLQDFAVLLAETLVAPVGLAGVLIVGAGLYVVTALLVPFLVSRILGLFWPPETWARTVDWASLIFLGLMTLAFFLAALIRAKKVHALYWAR